MVCRQRGWSIWLTKALGAGGPVTAHRERGAASIKSTALGICMVVARGRPTEPRCPPRVRSSACVIQWSIHCQPKHSLLRESTIIFVCQKTAGGGTKKNLFVSLSLSLTMLFTSLFPSNKARSSTYNHQKRSISTSPFVSVLWTAPP